jgi:prepilin-type N-terminal cleavage/methylation domain-containing protein
MEKRMSHRTNDGGFTLIELLIVLIILSVLAGIVVYAVGTTGSNAKAAACSADAKTFETALESYKAEVGYYPGAAALSSDATTHTGNGETWLNQDSSIYGVAGNPTATQGTWTIAGGATVIGPYMRQLPSTTNYQIVTDGQGGVFVYPPGAGLVDRQVTAMDNQTVGGVLGDGDTEPLNFETNPAICSDQNVVQ